MQVKKYIFFICCPLVMVMFSCEKKNQTEALQENVFKDSIDYWKRISPDEASYIKRLNKAFSDVKLETNDSIKIEHSLILSYAYYQVNDSAQFRKANSMARTWASKMLDSSNIAASYWDAGSFFRDRNVADSSYYNYAQAHKIYINLNNDYLASRMLYSMARNLGAIKDYTAAETYAIQAIELLKPLKNDNKISKLYNCYNFLGIISNNLKEYDKALEYHEQALNYLSQLESQGTLLTSTQNNIGAIYRDQQKYDHALKQFSQVAKTDSLYFKNPKLYAKALANCGYSQFKLGDTTSVLSKFNRAIRIQDSIGDTQSLSRSYYTMSEFLIAAKDTAKALNYAQKAIKTSQASDNNLRVLETLVLLSQINPGEAPSYMLKYQKLNDSLQTAERRGRNKFERIRFETNETIAENVLLSKKNQIWAAIAGGLLLFAIASYIIIDQRRKNEKLRFQEEQQEANQQISKLLLSEKEKIEEGKKLAQKRISEELHDAVQSRIQGIRMLLTGLNKRTTPEAIEERAEAIKELKSVQEEVRSISHELSHAAYQQISSFITTIQELLNGVEKNAELQSEFIFDETVAWDDLDSEVKINVYRIIQESIQNCVKYAEAELVKLTFDQSKDQMLTVIIEDNGKGFLVKNNKKGIGMRNINSRVEKLRGKWEIQSEIGEGTKVILYIPTSNSENPTKMAKMKIA